MKHKFHFTYTIGNKTNEVFGHNIILDKDDIMKAIKELLKLNPEANILGVLKSNGVFFEKGKYE